VAKAIKISKDQAVRSDWHKMKSLNWKFPTIRGGTSVVVAEFEGPHGKVRTKKDRERIYYILEGTGEFEIEEEKLPVQEGDVVAIPPGTWYNYWPTRGTLKVLLVMDLWNS
jgi:mannose-6-phosphate isomerase-like protein (cupin superfamily)